MPNQIKRETIITDMAGKRMSEKTARAVVSRVIHEQVHDAVVRGDESVLIEFDDLIGDGVTLRDILDLSGYSPTRPAPPPEGE